MTELLCSRVENWNVDKKMGRLIVTLDALPKDDEWYVDWWVSGFQGVPTAIKIKEDDLNPDAFANDLIRHAKLIWRVRTAEVRRRLKDHSTQPVALTDIVVFNPKDTFRLPKHDDNHFFDTKHGMVNGYKIHTGIYNGLFQLSTAAVMDVVIHESKSADGVWRSGFTLPVYTVFDLLMETSGFKWRIKTNPDEANAYMIYRSTQEESK